MKVVILCGGQGTRLREETEFRPKPMVDVGGKPILWHIMKRYAHFGYREFVLCLGYQGNIIKDYFLNYEAMNNDFTISLGNNQRIDYHGAHNEQDYQVTLANTGLDAMTGARIRQIKRYVSGDTFMVTYGDGLSDLDIDKLVAFHKSHGKLATLTATRPFSRFGSLNVGSAGEVHKFVEKPQTDAWANAGFFVFERGVFDYIDEEENCVFEHKPMERLALDGQLMAFRHDGFFFAMDTYREYLQLNQMWNDGTPPWISGISM